jgi:uncharacterized protein YjbI with pentapeptide repeats
VSSRRDWLAIGFGVVAMSMAAVFLPGLAGWAVAGGVVGLIAVGGIFWLRSTGQHDTSGEIGKLLLFGLAAALPSLVISHAIDERQATLERAVKKNERAQAQRERAQDLQLQIGFQRSLRGVDLAYRDLSRFQLPRRDLEGADLHGARLTDANLLGAHLKQANLDGARLDGADLTTADLSGASLAGASLRGAKLYSAHLEDACFAPLKDGRRSRRSDLRGARLAGAYLRGANFAGADLRRAAFAEDERDARELADAVLVGADTRAATFPPASGETHAPAFRVPNQPPVPIPADARSDLVDAVSDGDTLLLHGLGKVELLGVAAPSVVEDPTGLGGAAQRFLHTQLPAGTTVRYATVPQRDAYGQPLRDADGAPVALVDPFGRTFAYVWRMRASDGPDGWLVNERLLALGYAKTAPLANTVDDAVTQAMRASVEAARRAAHGVWSTCAS